MDAASASFLNGRGAPRLLRQFAIVERLTRDNDWPSGRARLEREVGCELAELLVGALVSVRPPAGLSRA